VPRHTSHLISSLAAFNGVRSCPSDSLNLSRGSLDQNTRPAPRCLNHSDVKVNGKGWGTVKTTQQGILGRQRFVRGGLHLKTTHATSISCFQFKPSSWHNRIMAQILQNSYPGYLNTTNMSASHSGQSSTFQSNITRKPTGR
jgi:hypothetical protein